MIFFFNDTATTEIYTLSLHDALPILREQAAGDDVILHLLHHYAPLWLAGILGAGIMAAVMASDSQILALSTMFAEDFFAFYGGRRGVWGRAQGRRGRPFVIVPPLLGTSRGRIERERTRPKSPH